MKTVEINYKGAGSNIYISEAWQLVQDLIPHDNVFIISDINVQRLYGDCFPDFPTITIGTGELVKELVTVETVIKHLLAAGADRSTFLLGIGGGIVCDIAGFVASVFMRGIDFGFISTTLLSQVDASVGGKNGVNINGIKNIAGCINQPEFVICDTSLLRTLDKAEYISGLGELVKHALILDSKLFEDIENNTEKLMARDTDLLEDMVFRSVQLKASVVQKDIEEKGLRRLLNFGHTLGHAVEAAEGIVHGSAVAYGMSIAASISRDEGYITDNDLDRINSLFKKLKLFDQINPDWNNVSNKILADKKRKGKDIYYILLGDIGRAIQVKYPLDNILKMIKIKIQ